MARRKPWRRDWRIKTLKIHRELDECKTLRCNNPSVILRLNRKMTAPLTQGSQGRYRARRFFDMLISLPPEIWSISGFPNQRSLQFQPLLFVTIYNIQDRENMVYFYCTKVHEEQKEWTSMDCRRTQLNILPAAWDALWRLRLKIPKWWHRPQSGRRCLFVFWRELGGKRIWKNFCVLFSLVY